MLVQTKYIYCFFQIGTPFWEIGAPMQYYISKQCATYDKCHETRNTYMPHCSRIWWKDWRCAECCRGDRCNYYITVSIALSIFYIHNRLFYFDVLI